MATFYISDYDWNGLIDLARSTGHISPQSRTAHRLSEFLTDLLDIPIENWNYHRLSGNRDDLPRARNINLQEHMLKYFVKLGVEKKIRPRRESFTSLGMCSAVLVAIGRRELTTTLKFIALDPEYQDTYPVISFEDSEE